MGYMTVRQASDYMGYNLKTLQMWDRRGLLVAGRTKTNRRVYQQSDLDIFLNKKFGLSSRSVERQSVAYRRVSSRNQMQDMKNQRRVLEDFCIARGLAGVVFVEEVGGGLNFNRKEFLNLIDGINQGKIERLIVAHKDRLTRFGFGLIEHLCKSNNVELLVMNSEQLSPEQEMVQDLMTIVHCFSSRLYGLRNYRKTLQESLKK